MKAFLYTVGAVLAALLLWTWWKSRSAATDLQTQAQRNAQGNATLSSYQDLMPIAQLERVPWTTTNLRMNDPIIPPPIAYPLIPQNGGW